MKKKELVFLCFGVVLLSVHCLWLIVVGTDCKSALSGIRPNGALKTLEGDDYVAARKSANTANAALRRSNPEFFKGLEIHEIQPVKFNGSPTDFSNKLFLTRSEHIKFTNYWNQVLRNK